MAPTTHLDDAKERIQAEPLLAALLPSLLRLGRRRLLPLRALPRAAAGRAGATQGQLHIVVTVGRGLCNGGCRGVGSGAHQAKHAA